LALIPTCSFRSEELRLVRPRASVGVVRFVWNALNTLSPTVRSSVFGAAYPNENAAECDGNELWLAAWLRLLTPLPLKRAVFIAKHL